MDLSGAAVSKAAKQKELAQRWQGRTPEQQKIISYFFNSSGCFSSGLSDTAYESMVMAKAKSMDFKQKALNKIGLDESQVNEVTPIHFENYWWGDSDRDTNKFLCIRGKDGIWRTSAYQITWIFFSSTQIYVYQYTFHMDEDGKKERTEEYFYKDITNFSTASDTVEKEISIGKGVFRRQNVDTHKFSIIVPGDKFYCAMQQNDYTEKAIQGMKAKLREKKG